jgi:small-conductance mechanosensitive channel
MTSIKKFLEFKILEIDKYSLSVYDFVLILTLILVGIVLVKISRRIIYKSDRLDVPKKFVLKKIFQYIISVAIVFFCLKILGLNITLFLAGSAALLVGLGFGLQHLFNDFMSGLLILLDSSIKVGDVIEIDCMIYYALKKSNISIPFPQRVIHYAT